MAIIQTKGQCYQWDGEGDFEVVRIEGSNDRPRHFKTVPASTHPIQPTERFTRDQIRPLQVIIAPILAKYGRFELCGSYRRGKKTVKDMDYVIQATREGFGRLRSELEGSGVVFHRGASDIMNGTIQGLPVDFFRAEPESYTSILIWRTGSKNHNIHCAIAARKRGMRVRRSGIELNGLILHPMTEYEFYETLGIPYIAPENRDMEV